MAKSKPNKSDFVRSQPASMGAAEVVSKAKAAGIIITKGLVYVVRSSRTSNKKKGTAPAKSAATAAAKPAAHGGKGSASDFIRSQPKSASAKQVSQAGHKVGFSFKPALVYTVRRAQEKRDGKPPGRRGRAPGSKNKGAPAASGGMSAASKNALRTLLTRFEALAAQLHRELK